MKKNPTIIDVAQQAGVSPSTVSRVFDPSWNGRIREETRRIVLQTANQLGYHGSNALARGLFTQRSGIIAFVIGKSVSDFYIDIVKKFLPLLQERGKQVLIFEIDPVVGVENILTQVHRYRTDAIIIASSATSSEIINPFFSTNIPIIIFNRYIPDSNFSAVYCDVTAATAQAADYLMAQGHKTFGIFNGSATIAKEIERVEGFAAQVNKRGGSILWTQECDFSYTAGHETALATLSEQPWPDAIFCTSDIIALGVMDVIRKKFHKSIPQDISVIGFDNIPASAFDAYDLTTISYPFERMIPCTVALLERILSSPSTHVERVFDMELIKRGSVAPKYELPQA